MVASALVWAGCDDDTASQSEIMSQDAGIDTAEEEGGESTEEEGDESTEEEGDESTEEEGGEATEEEGGEATEEEGGEATEEEGGEATEEEGGEAAEEEGGEAAEEEGGETAEEEGGEATEEEGGEATEEEGGDSEVTTYVVTTTDDFGQVNAYMDFAPENLVIPAGSIVRFEMSTTHNAIEVSKAIYDSRGTTPLEGGFAVQFGETVEVTFAEPGIHYYVCQPHVNMDMIGTITVE